MTPKGQTGELRVELGQPLEFTDGATTEEDSTFEVILRGPTYREMDLAARLEQYVYQAFRNAQNDRPAAGEAPSAEEKALALADKAEDAADDEEEEMTAARAWALLSMFSTDIRPILADFEKLAVKVGRLNDETPLTLKLYRSLSVDDIRKLVSEYVAFFIGRSVVSTMKALR